MPKMINEDSDQKMSPAVDNVEKASMNGKHSKERTEIPCIFQIKKKNCFYSLIILINIYIVFYILSMNIIMKW